MAYLGSVLSSHGEKHPEPKSGLDLDQTIRDALRPVGEMKPIQIFHALFSGFLSPIANFINQPENHRVDCNVGSSRTLA